MNQAERVIQLAEEVVHEAQWKHVSSELAAGGICRVCGSIVGGGSACLLIAHPNGSEWVCGDCLANGRDRPD